MDGLRRHRTRTASAGSPACTTPTARRPPTAWGRCWPLRQRRAARPSSTWAAGPACPRGGPPPGPDRSPAIEPSDDMRAGAEAHRTPAVRYRAASAERTGLPDGAADVVLAVQAMHWMEPGADAAGGGPAPAARRGARRGRRRLAARCRAGRGRGGVGGRPPPDSGSSRPERREGRRGRSCDGRSPPTILRWSTRTCATRITTGPFPAACGHGRSGEHLGRMSASGHFAFVREVVFDQPMAGGADRFVALMRSQGSYQGLRRLGLSDADLAIDPSSATCARRSPGPGRRPACHSHGASAWA